MGLTISKSDNENLIEQVIHYPIFNYVPSKFTNPLYLIDEENYEYDVESCEYRIRYN